MDLLSKIENTKAELEEFKKTQGTGENPGAGDNPPDDVAISNIRKDLEGDLPEAEPLNKEEINAADEHKFNVLQEKYNKEVPRLHSENKELRSKISTLESTVEELRGLIKELKTEKPPVKQEPEPHKATKYSKLDPEEFKDFDDGVIKIINTLNAVIEDADMLKQENTRLKSENDAFKQEFSTVKDTATRASETVLRNSEKSFWGEVRTAAPKFDEYNGDANGQNADPRWGNFLDGFDPKTGEQLRVKASKAINSGDSKTLVSIVKQFETLVIGNVEDEPGNGKKPSLDDTIVPDRGAGPAGGAKGTGKLITEKEIDYAEKMYKAGKLKPDDYHKLLDRYKKQLQTGQGR